MMMLLLQRALPLFALAAIGCAATQVTIDDVVSAGQRNPFKALDEYEGKDIEVTGVVDSTGIQGFEVAKLERSGIWGPTTVHRGSKEYPYVELTGREGGRLRCYFAPADRGQVGDLHVGQLVTLTGTFNRFLRYADGTLVAQLAACDVKG